MKVQDIRMNLGNREHHEGKPWMKRDCNSCQSDQNMGRVGRMKEAKCRKTARNSIR